MPKVDETNTVTKPRKKTQGGNGGNGGKGKGKKSSPSDNGQKVIYPEITVTKAIGAHAATEEQIKDLLGWQEVKEWDASCCPEIRTLLGKNVRLTKNGRNRPFTMGDLLDLKQEHLNRRWKLNLETIVVGRYGNVMSGQHRGVSFVIACEEYRSDTKEGEHWRALNPNPPTMETLIAYGADESDEVFRTLNCGKPATYAEVLYRSNYLADQTPTDRKVLATMIERAVQLLWHRTGAKLDAYAPRRTHGESDDFLRRHPRVLDCVKHIHAENGKKVLTTLCGPIPGTLAGLMYLMAASGSKFDDYYPVNSTANDRSEESLDMGRYDQAAEFFTALKESPDMQAVRNALADLNKTPSGRRRITVEVLAVLVKAWLVFVTGRPIKAKDLALKWEREYDPETEVEVERVLDECPSVGGADRGDPDEPPPPPADEDDEEEADPDVEEGSPEDEEEGEDEEDADEEPEEEEDEQAPPAVRRRKARVEEELANRKTLRAQLEELRAEYPDTVLLFKTKAGVVAWNGDATLVANALGLKVETGAEDLDKVAIESVLAPGAVSKLIKAKFKLAYVSGGKDGAVEVNLLDEKGRPITRAKT